jgi:hypothetical protein
LWSNSPNKADSYAFLFRWNRLIAVFSSSIVQGCSIKNAGLDELMGPFATKTQCHIKNEHLHIEGVVPNYVSEWTIEVMFCNVAMLQNP